MGCDVGYFEIKLNINYLSLQAREEKLVLRLVEIVRMRDELVQQIDAERRRERQEDLAIAASIASKRGKMQ